MSDTDKVTQEELVSYMSVLQFAVSDLEKLLALYPGVTEVQLKSAAMNRAVRAVDHFVSLLKKQMPLEARKAAEVKE